MKGRINSPVAGLPGKVLLSVAVWTSRLVAIVRKATKRPERSMLGWLLPKGTPCTGARSVLPGFSSA